MPTTTICARRCASRSRQAASVAKDASSIFQAGAVIGAAATSVGSHAEIPVVEHLGQHVTLAATAAASTAGGVATLLKGSAVFADRLADALAAVGSDAAAEDGGDAIFFTPSSSPAASRPSSPAALHPGARFSSPAEVARVPLGLPYDPSLHGPRPDSPRPELTIEEWAARRLRARTHDRMMMGYPVVNGAWAPTPFGSELRIDASHLLDEL